MSGPYVYVCNGCNLLAQSGRRDTLTCSPACRVRAHRNGSAKALRGMASNAKSEPWMIVQGAAMHRLRPDLADQVMAGTLTFEGAQPEMNAALLKLLLAEAAKRNGSAEALQDEPGAQS